MNMSVSGLTGMRPPRPEPTAMKMKMAQLQQTDPALAEKLDKVRSRLEELRKSGASAEDAKTTIDKEFGKPTDQETKTLQSIFGQRGPGTNGSFAPPVHMHGPRGHHGGQHQQQQQQTNLLTDATKQSSFELSA